MFNKELKLVDKNKRIFVLISKRIINQCEYFEVEDDTTKLYAVNNSFSLSAGGAWS